MFHVGGREVAAKQQKRHVGKLEFSMQHHIHMHMAATYFNIPHVEKITYPTWKQAQKSNATTKQNVNLKQSCGS